MKPAYKLEDRGLGYPFFFDPILGDKTTANAEVEAFTFSLLLQSWESLRLLGTDQNIIVFSLSFVYLWLFMHIQVSATKNSLKLVYHDQICAARLS